MKTAINTTQNRLPAFVSKHCTRKRFRKEQVKKSGYVMTLLLLAGAFATFTAPAQEHPVGRSSGPTTAEETANVVSYWTPERLANAIPMELLEADRSQITGVETATTSRTPQVFVEGRRPQVNHSPVLSGPKIGVLETPGNWKPNR